MQIADRHEHSATLLPNGKVLVVGGYHGTYPSYTYLPDAEIFDPASGNWTAIESLTGPRAFQSATLLASGKVLVVGGEYQAGSPRHELNTAVLYDPDTGHWSADSTLNYGRLSHATVVLGSGRILVVNGASSGGVIRTAEVYDPRHPHLGTGRRTECIQVQLFAHPACQRQNSSRRGTLHRRSDGGDGNVR